MAQKLYVATRKGLFTLVRNSTRWDVIGRAFVGDNVTIVMPDSRDGSLYVALEHGHFGCKLHRLSNGASEWHECAPPQYPEQPAGHKDVCPMSGIEIPWSLKLMWSLAIAGDTPGSLWCGTVPGGLFMSQDHGQSWSLVESLWQHPQRKAWFGGGLDYPGIHSVCVDPNNDKHVIVGVSCGGVWITHDQGRTWECGQGMRAEYMPPERQFEPVIQDPHMIVQCASTPDVLWAQHHNGIFLSEDGAATWTEITAAQPSSFGFCVAVHPRNPDIAWFVPAIKDELRVPVNGQFVVSRTSDRGRSFELLRNGLPQQDAYHLVFRHALDVDDTGDTLALGSTTGSLWTSSDGGDHWQHITADLPPVHCVRFGQ